MKIYITGASGVGTTTLGKNLSARLSINHVDSDELFWQKTDPPYAKPRNINELHEMFCKAITSSDSFVLSGDILHWGLDQTLFREFSYVIFLCLPLQVREMRIRQREERRFGKRILSGGDMYRQHEDFIEWIKKYDENDEKLGRNKKSQEDFVSKFEGKVMRVDTEIPQELLLQQALRFLKSVR